MNGEVHKIYTKEQDLQLEMFLVEGRCTDNNAQKSPFL